MRASGDRTSSTAMARNFGPMKRSTRENTAPARNTERDFSYGKTIAHMRESLVRTTSTASEDTSGKMAGSMKENGRTTKWTEEESSLGSTAAGIKESTATTRKKALVSSPSETDVCMKGNGPMASSMERASSARRISQERDCGKKENGFNGSTRPSKTSQPRTKSATLKILLNDQHILCS